MFSNAEEEFPFWARYLKAASARLRPNPISEATNIVFEVFSFSNAEEEEEIFSSVTISV